MCLPKLNIYQSTIAPNCLRATQNIDVLIFLEEKFCLMFGLKFTLCLKLSGSFYLYQEAPIFSCKTNEIYHRHVILR